VPLSIGGLIGATNIRNDYGTISSKKSSKDEKKLNVKKIHAELVVSNHG